MAWGERAFAGLIGLIGLLWIWQSQSLGYWSDFAPGSGFLPFWLGVILTVLTAVFLVGSVRAPRPEAVASESRRGRVAAIAGGFSVCVAVLESLGFLLAVTIYLFFLSRIVERRPLIESIVAPPATSFILWLIFKQWLKVPMPIGPLGF